MAEQRKQVPGQTYNRIFQQDKDGQAILDELYLQYAEPNPHVPGDEIATGINIGKAELVKEIMRRCAS